MKINFLLVIGFIVILCNLAKSQNPGDVALNEIMYAPTPATNEWFELYNNTAAPFNMANWKYKDATATLRIFTTQNINLPANGYAVICQDSTSFRTAFPSFTGILLQPTNGWSALNNTGNENVIIFNASGVVIDSIQYTNTWGGASGNKSLERIISIAPTNQQTNWGTSVATLGATPNLRNSISPLNNDLSLNIISFSSNSPLIGTNLQITANVKNRGLLTANSYTVSFYDDYNDDGNPTPNELINSVNSAGALNAGDSANYNTSKLMDSLGVRQFIAVVNYGSDEDTSNNKRIGTVTVISAGGFDSLVVNEIMYAPTTGNSKEWFEIYNKSSSPVNLQNWKWDDATFLQRVITTQSVSIPANGFAVICEDSTAVKSFYPNNPGIYLQSIGWNALNNTGDNIVLLNSAGTVIDSVTFLSSWGGSTNNKSLERVSVTGNSNLQTNWGSCVSSVGATPDKVNSLTPKPNDLALNKIAFSRTLPALGDTLGIIAQVKNRGLNSAPSYTVSFYDDYNKDSIPTPNELKTTINSPGTLNSGDSVNITYSQILDSAGLRQYIAVVNYAPDEDTTNNKYAASIEVAGGSTAGRVIINEIMYDFPAGECEWVEIYNNSDSVVNLKNWKISDNSLTQVIITANDYFMNPHTYVVISQSSAIFANHVKMDSTRVITNSSLPSLNNTGDAVLIYKINGAVSDRVDYSPDWGGTNVSLERIDFNGVSNDSSNWASSIDCEKSTPTRVNSISSAQHYSRNDLIINEIMAAPTSNGSEYIELYNPTSQTINIVGWLFTETGGTQGITDTCSALIKPGMYAVIAADTNIYHDFPYLRTPDSTQKVFISGSLGLNNDADLTKIADVFRTMIDSVYYSDNWYNPNLPGSGRSLEKINPSFNGNDGRNWSSCTYPNGGSPGLKNSVYTSNSTKQGEVTISPNPFSPDNDGYEDFTIISYSLQNPVSQVRMKIFDVKGRLIKTLLNNQSSGSTGQIVYNGLDDENRKLRLGIYIVFLEALNDQNGVVESIKTTMVVGAKL
ncbi:MAG: lamin tail domain-containing protein [Ignavibacteria bacterium]